MNRNYDLQLTAVATYKDQDFEFTFNPYNDCTDMDSLKDFAQSEIESSDEFEDGEGDGVDLDEVKVKITDFSDVPTGYDNEDDVWEFAKAFAECEQEIDIVEAALQCDVNPADIDEAYSGEFDDDKDFARDMADQLGAVDKNASWPMTCIDWEAAAKELMYDYNEHNGHYFRCF
jgi:antirestriction protein